MKRMNVLPAPRIDPIELGEGKWKKWNEERRAFQRLRPSLLRTHLGKYVAIHNGKVVGSGRNQIALGLRAYARFGYVPIYVTSPGRAAASRANSQSPCPSVSPRLSDALPLQSSGQPSCAFR
jgi:hypothetical protein